METRDGAKKKKKPAKVGNLLATKSSFDTDLV